MVSEPGDGAEAGEAVADQSFRCGSKTLTNFCFFFVLDVGFICHLLFGIKSTQWGGRIVSWERRSSLI